jgi:hypothetical protein
MTGEIDPSPPFITKVNNGLELYLYFPNAFTICTGATLPYFSDRKELNKILMSLIS